MTEQQTPAQLTSPDKATEMKLVEQGSVRPTYISVIRPTPEQQELTALEPQQWPTKVPGDVDQITVLANRLQTVATTMSDQRHRLLNVDVATFWSGKSAEAFTTYKQQLPPKLDTAHKRYQGTATALTTYNKKLTEAQQTAQTASRRAEEAKQQIEAAGHKVAEWPQYCGHHPDPVSPVAQPMQQQEAPATSSPTTTEAADVQPAAQTAKPVPVHQVPAPTPVPNNGLIAAYEEFYAALRLMVTAIDSYTTAASTCAAAINHASDDSMKDSAGFGTDLGKLKTELLKALSGQAPELRNQISKLTGVAGMLGLIAAVTLGAKSKSATSTPQSTLGADAEGWQKGTTDGKKVVDDFLGVLTSTSGKLSVPPMGHLDDLHKGSFHLGQDPTTATDPTQSTQPVQGTVPPTQTITSQGPDGTWNVNIYVGGATGATPQVTSNTLPVPAAT